MKRLTSGRCASCIVEAADYVTKAKIIARLRALAPKLPICSKAFHDRNHHNIDFRTITCLDCVLVCYSGLSDFLHTLMSVKRLQCLSQQIPQVTSNFVRAEIGCSVIYLSFALGSISFFSVTQES